MIGPSLLTLRERAGASVVDVARQLEMSDRFISMVEAGRVTPNPGMVHKITKAIIAAQNEKAPGASAVVAADQEPSQTETNRQEGTNPMSIIMHQPSDSQQTLVVVPCEHPGCDQYATGHEVEPLDVDGLMHVHSGSWEKAPGSVDCYYDNQLGRWHAGGSLDDSDAPLTFEQVHDFTKAWDRAYAAAQELNATEATC